MVKLKKIINLLTCFSFLYFVPAVSMAKPMPDSFADLVDELMPSVVNISTTQNIKENMGIVTIPSFPPNSPFEEFYKDFFGDNMGALRGQPTERKATSLGSGFIIDETGYVVTNNHVIDGADKITVILSDDTAVDAKLVGRDKKTDIALLKIETKTPLKAVKFGDSDTARVGDWVLAIGNPFGLGGTVTAGIISARARDIHAGPYDNFLQTDASINRGNSGGPMFNVNGEVIGINAAIFSTNGGSMGIGFAIPSNIANWVIESLRKDGHIKRGWIGVSIQSNTEEIAETLGMKKPIGAVIADIDKDGPAYNAGIQAGDVIIEFDGKEIDSMRRLPLVVAETLIGKNVGVSVWRKGVKKDLTIKVAEMPEEATDATKITSTSDTTDDNSNGIIDEFGINVTPINPDIIAKYRLPETAMGVVITAVKRGGQGIEKGLRPGDVITEVNQKAVKSAADIRKQIKSAQKAGKKSVLMLVDGGDGLRFIALKID